MKYGVILWLLLFCAAYALAQDAATLRRAAIYEPLMIEAGARHGVDPRLLWTIAFLETRFRPDQISHAGARGMMQFMPMTAVRFDLDDPHDPAASIDAAARYLRELQAAFGHRLDLILAAYNAGENAVIAFRDGRTLLLSNGKAINPKAIQTGGVPPYRETCAYVNDGIALYLRLAGKREWPRGVQLAKYQRLKMPEGRPIATSTDPTPDEINQLKQGSIYVLDSSVGKTTTPHLPPNAAARSIYVQ